MSGAGLLVAALAVAVLIALLRLGIALAKAAAKPPPGPPDPTPPQHPTWADVHAKAAAIAREGQWVTITPRQFERLRGIHGPEDQAAAAREVRALAEYESEFRS